jgi:hypothetical protein
MNAKKAPKKATIPVWTIFLFDSGITSKEMIMATNKMIKINDTQKNKVNILLKIFIITRLNFSCLNKLAYPC